MASYIPWFGKKRAALAEHEQNLREAIESKVAPALLAKAAEEVRNAHLRALRARLAQLAPCGKNAVANRNILREMETWRQLSTEQIIQGYRDGKLQGVRSSQIRRTARV